MSGWDVLEGVSIVIGLVALRLTWVLKKRHAERERAARNPRRNGGTP